MNKFWIIFSHTYLEKVKSKTFLITTALLLLTVAAAANFQTIAGFFSGEDEERDKIAIIDNSDLLFGPYKQSVESANDSLELIPFTDLEEAGKTAVQEEKYAALVVMDMDADALPEATYFANNITDSSTQADLEEQLQYMKVAMSIEQAGFDEQAVQEIYAPVNFETVALDEDAKTLEEMFQAQGIIYVMLFFMYMVVILYGQMIAQDVANEKSSRVMEILISSASPVTHMFAKIFGVALVGLTQILLLVGVGYALISSRKEELVGSFLDTVGLVDIPVDLVIYAIIFFLLGYTLYATLAAMLGSLVSRSEDVGQLLMPMIILIVIAFLVAMYGLGAPESRIVTISSFIPFFTPMVMILRIGMLNLPLWEIGLSIAILIVSIIILGLIGARVYKGGVLMYGRTGSLKDFTKAIRLSKKEK
ncbi:ABC transporter permease [Oceanobacillus alkalisoli]|uniref:ABC transporter permease n=1 Tax=Oceanobacillus alkalisoli TaxID=2925113 RepID=UPI001F11AE0B|nr:ABC transporter permease [Oceanobacillus alkalisoli]MCF3942022.1 ABC transporter permease [Oceanobacillus alkalisoli]